MNYTYGENSLRNSYHTVRLFYLSLILTVMVSHWVPYSQRFAHEGHDETLRRSIRITHCAVARALCLVGFNVIWVVVTYTPENALIYININIIFLFRILIITL